MNIASAVRSGAIKALVILKENAMHLGLSVEELAQMPALIVMNTLPNEATKNATVVLPACGFAEKRGSMVNGKGRLQRLNRAIRPPGNARDDWEILRDLLQAVGGGDSLHSIEEVFRRISETVPRFAGLSLSKMWSAFPRLGTISIRVTPNELDTCFVNQSSSLVIRPEATMAISEPENCFN